MSDNLLHDTMNAYKSQNIDELESLYHMLLETRVTPKCLIAKFHEALLFWVKFIDYGKDDIIKKTINSGFLQLLIDECAEQDVSIRLSLCELWAENNNIYSFKDAMKLYKINNNRYTINDFYENIPGDYQLGVLI